MPRTPLADFAPTALTTGLTALAMTALAPAASAQIMTSRFDVNAQSESSVRFAQSDANDERNFSTTLNYSAESNDDVFPAPPVTSLQRVDTQALINSTRASLSGFYTSTLSSDAASMTFDLAAAASAVSNNPDASAESRFNANAQIRVEAEIDTVVQITLRALYTGADPERVFADGRLFVNGVGSSGADVIEFNSDDGAFDRTITYTASLSARRPVIARIDADLFLDPGLAQTATDLDRLLLFAEIRVIPAPGTTAALAGLGLLASRRRRAV